LNKKVLLAAGTIAAVAAAALVATYAAWQATDQITGNTVSTAQLKITAAGEAGGTSAYPTEAKPIDWADALPGMTSSPEERAVVTNDSSIALDLWMYYENTDEAPCLATKVAWQSSLPGGPVLGGYPAAPAP